MESKQEFLRRQDESFLEYCERLISGKESGLYDLDKSEIWKLLLDEELSSEESRKRIYALKSVIKKLKDECEKSITDDAIAKRIITEREQIEKEKINLKDQRREFKRLLSSQARFEYIKEYIGSTAREITKEKPFEWKQIPTYIGEKESILMIGDWHSELEVDNFLNKFNKEELLRRINKLVSKTIEYGKFHKINTLRVINLNDMISGIIHFNSRVASNEDTVSQIMIVSELLSDMLVKFANEFNQVKYYNVLDNHSRVNANKDEAIDKESFARFIPWFIKERVKDIKNIEIVENEFDDYIATFDVCGYSCIAVHGNQDRINNVVQNLTLMTKKFYSYFLLGHYHHSSEDEVHSCEIIANSSLIGTDDYSKKLRKSSKPAQKLLIFNKDDGREATYSIRLDN